MHVSSRVKQAGRAFDKNTFILERDIFHLQIVSSKGDLNRERINNLSNNSYYVKSAPQVRVGDA